MRAALFVLALLVCTSCAGRQTRETQVRTALDVLGEVIDPAYSLAVDGCIARQGEAVKRAEAGDPTGRSDYRSIQAHCDAAADVFDQIRIAHHEAAVLVERGELAAAEDKLNKVRELWRGLREHTP